MNANESDDDDFKVLTIPQVAKLAKVSVSRMRRYLIAKHNELKAEDGIGLLVDVSRGAIRPRYTVTMRALKASSVGGWFRDPDALDRKVEWVADEVDAMRETIATLSKRVSLQHQRLVALATR